MTWVPTTKWVPSFNESPNARTIAGMFSSEGFSTKEEVADFIETNWESDYWSNCEKFIKENWNVEITSLTEKQNKWAEKILEDIVERKIEG